MNKLTNIKLNPKSFAGYSKAVSGLFLATSGEALTETDLKLIWNIKTGFAVNQDPYVTKKLRYQLMHSMELKAQTLYNRLSDLKRKGILVKKDKKITLSPVFNNKTNVTISYNANENREFQNSVTREATSTEGEIS